MMAFCSKYKSKSEQRPIVDLPDDDMLKRTPFGWQASYSQRALCVRIVCPACERMISKTMPKILRVKFITRGLGSKQQPEYNWKDPYVCVSMDEFYENVTDLVEEFVKCDIVSDWWEGISNTLELSHYKYENTGLVDRWITDPLISPTEYDERLATLSLDQQQFVGTLEAALKGDVKNGALKTLMSVVIPALLQSNNEYSPFQVLCVIPSRDCTTNTQVEICADEYENAPHSSTPVGSFDRSSSVESLNLEHGCDSSSSDLSESARGSSGRYTKTRHIVVPDFCVLLSKFPGMFPLVVKFESAGQESEGLFQNVQQMLSKLFFQDVVFGMVISPIAYQLTVIMKINGHLRFASTGVISLIALKASVYRLDVEKLKSLCAFIYSVLKWALKTNCMVENKKDVNK